jgi:hypothetical protein
MGAGRCEAPTSRHLSGSEEYSLPEFPLHELGVLDIVFQATLSTGTSK